MAGTPLTEVDHGPLKARLQPMHSLVLAQLRSPMAGFGRLGWCRVATVGCQLHDLALPVSVPAGGDPGGDPVVPQVRAFRDVEELLAERGIAVDHVTVYRWV
jgi:hypothetical protein